MSLPVLVTLGLVGLETANLAMAHLRVSNIAMLTADNAARVRDSIDEANVIELLTGAKMTGDSIRFRRTAASSCRASSPIPPARTAPAPASGSAGSAATAPRTSSPITARRAPARTTPRSRRSARRATRSPRPRARRSCWSRSSTIISRSSRARSSGPPDPLRERVQRAPADQPGAHQSAATPRRAAATTFAA